MNLLEHIKMARKYAIKECINANKIIIDKDLALLNADVFGYFDGLNNQYIQTPKMIMGMSIAYEENLKSDYGCNFVIAEVPEEEKETKTLSDYTTDELLEELRRRTNA